jgi:hypothetical protein
MCRFIVGSLIVGCALTAASASCAEEEYVKLPEGVIHVVLPPGEVKIEDTIKNGKPLLRLSASKAVIVARRLFLGDGKGATEVEATNEGMHWPHPNGKKGFVLHGEMTHEPGATIGAEH